MGPFDLAWMYATIRLSSPLVFASMGELVAERTGVINIGLEGMILAGAFFGFLVSALTGSVWLGAAAGAIAGIGFSVLMAALSITLKADQIVVGVGILLGAIGLTSFLDQEILQSPALASSPRMAPFAIPFLSEIPTIGPLLFNHIPLVYVAYAVVPATWLLLYRTRFGLAGRAAGARPAAVDTSGISVDRTRWIGTLIAGSGGGLAGAFLSVGQLGLFVQEMSGGRGFLALAAVFFGKWRPGTVLLGCLVFGGADALQLRLQAEPFISREVWLVVALGLFATAIRSLMSAKRSPTRMAGLPQPALGGLVAVALGGLALALYVVAPEWSFPSEVWRALPFIATLVVLASVAGGAEMPSSLGLPYVREGA